MNQMSEYSHKSKSTHRTGSTNRTSSTANRLRQMRDLPAAGVKTGMDQQTKDFTAMYGNESAPRVNARDAPTHIPRRELQKNAIPGYTGYVGGWKAEVNYGQTFENTKNSGVQLMQDRREGRIPKDLTLKSGPNMGLENPPLFNNLTSSIAGYTGYIPQKQVQNTFGRSFKRENAVARHIIENVGAGTSRAFPEDGAGLSLTAGKFYDSNATSRPRQRGSTPPPITGLPGYTGYFPKYMEEQRWLAKTFLDKYQGVGSDIKRRNGGFQSSAPAAYH